MMMVLLVFQWQGGGIPEVFRQLVKAGLGESVDFVQGVAEAVPVEREAYFSEIGEWFDKSGGWFDFIRTLKRNIRLVDLVHVNSLKILLLLLIIGQWRKPIVFQVHGEYGYLKRRSIAEKVKFILLYCVVIILNVREIICVNSYIREKLYSLPVKCVVIENGIARSKRTFSKRSSALPIVIGVGRLDPEKQFDKFIEIAQMVNMTTKVKFHVYGQGELHSYLQKLIEKKELQDVVCLKGFTSDPLAAMASSDVLLCTSSREGSPMTFAEAFSVGLPVVTFPVGVARDLMKWNWAVSVGDDISKLARYINNLITEDKTLMEMRRKQCLTLFEECFDAKKKVSIYEEVYKRAAV